MSDNDSWDEVKVPNTEQKEVEFEVEGEEEKAAPEVESKPEVEAEPQKKENKEPELEGIETKGAEKRIRQLIKTKKRKR